MDADQMQDHLLLQPELPLMLSLAGAMTLVSPMHLARWQAGRQAAAQQASIAFSC